MWLSQLSVGLPSIAVRELLLPCSHIPMETHVICMSSCAGEPDLC